MKLLRVRVYHDYYGCDTGCCGHSIEVTDENGSDYPDIGRCFEFDHPNGEDVDLWAREFAERQIRQHAPECIDSIDWDSLEVDTYDC